MGNKFKVFLLMVISGVASTLSYIYIFENANQGPRHFQGFLRKPMRTAGIRYPIANMNTLDAETMHKFLQKIYSHGDKNRTESSSSNYPRRRDTDGYGEESDKPLPLPDSSKDLEANWTERDHGSAEGYKKASEEAVPSLVGRTINKVDGNRTASGSTSEKENTKENRTSSLTQKDRDEKDMYKITNNVTKTADEYVEGGDKVLPPAGKDDTEADTAKGSEEKPGAVAGNRNESNKLTLSAEREDTVKTAGTKVREDSDPKLAEGPQKEGDRPPSSPVGLQPNKGADDTDKKLTAGKKWDNPKVPGKEHYANGSEMSGNPKPVADGKNQTNKAISPPDNTKSIADVGGNWQKTNESKKRDPPKSESQIHQDKTAKAGGKLPDEPKNSGARKQWDKPPVKWDKTKPGDGQLTRQRPFSEGAGKQWNKPVASPVGLQKGKIKDGSGKWNPGDKRPAEMKGGVKWTAGQGGSKNTDTGKPLSGDPKPVAENGEKTGKRVASPAQGDKSKSSWTLKWKDPKLADRIKDKAKPAPVQGKWDKSGLGKATVQDSKTVQGTGNQSGKPATTVKQGDQVGTGKSNGNQKSMAGNEGDKQEHWNWNKNGNSSSPVSANKAGGGRSNPPLTEGNTKSVSKNGTVDKGGNPMITHDFNLVLNEPMACKKADGVNKAVFLLVLVVTTHEKSDVRQTIRETWARPGEVMGKTIVVLFMLGQSTNSTLREIVQKESDQYHDILMEDFVESYKNLTLKTMMGMRWAGEYCPQAAYVMKTDDDMYVNRENLARLLASPTTPTKRFMTGHVFEAMPPIRESTKKNYMPVEMYGEQKYPPYCAGAAYVMSGDLPALVFNMATLSPKYIHIEDVLVGICLRKVGIKPVHNSGFRHNAMPFIPYSFCEYRNVITMHGATISDMMSIWNGQNVHQSNETCNQKN
ncbi:uncharacterized protein LOC119745481 [Patiria miniata]|uniref:Uncharacterized protein n=1 Tax=Patiria miniata TaxID=46514 RepID=A0A914BQ21_PATMI|nr:uncharacterized protein LOC119745481 [Patiria miniata]